MLWLPGLDAAAGCGGKGRHSYMYCRSMTT
jgi:hypothetical protein